MGLAAMLPGWAEIVWCDELQTDLGLQRLVPDFRWQQLKTDVAAALALG